MYGSTAVLAQTVSQTSSEAFHPALDLPRVSAEPNERDVRPRSGIGDAVVTWQSQVRSRPRGRHHTRRRGRTVVDMAQAWDRVFAFEDRWTRADHGRYQARIPP